MLAFGIVMSPAKSRATRNCRNDSWHQEKCRRRNRTTTRLSRVSYVARCCRNSARLMICTSVSGGVTLRHAAGLSVTTIP